MLVPRMLAESYVRAHFAAKDSPDPQELWLQECIICGHQKWKTRFNVAKCVGFCFRRYCAFTLFDLVRHVSGEITLRGCLRVLEEFEQEGRVLVAPKLSERDSPVFLHLQARSTAMRERLAQLWREGEEEASTASSSILSESLALPESFSVDWTSAVAKRYWEYALKRRVPDWMFEEGRVGWCRKGRMAKRLVFLIMEEGKPVYYAGRAILADKLPKMLYPPKAEALGRGMSSVVFNLDRVPEGAELLACEGPISALSAGEHGIAYLGHKVSDVQARLIARKKPKSITLLRERDVSAETLAENAQVLRSAGVETRFANLIYGDPDDSPEKMPEVLALASQGDRLGLLRERLKETQAPLDALDKQGASWRS